MAARFSNSNVDRIGERLRGRDYDEGDLRLLEEYRGTFGPAYDRVVETIQRITGLAVSGRPAKSTTSIVEKLGRESIRLSQMQDIAGCRVVVTDLAEQDRTVAAIEAAFDRVTLLDRRRKPSHGYRAVHLVVRDSGKMVEVQVRTALQHSWAELCEKAADVVDPSVKYGGGPAVVRGFLDRMAESVKRIEEVESALARAGAGDRTLADELQDVRNEQARLMRALVKYLSESKMESQDDFLDRIR